jgi:soluble lytic murein transglycosylase-like protein
MISFSFLFSRRQRSTNTSLMALSLVFLLAQDAQALQTLVRPPVLLKEITRSVPHTFDDVMAHDQTGLDYETPETHQAALDQAATYIAFRKGELGEIKSKRWRKECELSRHKESQRTDIDPYCALETDRAHHADPSINSFFSMAGISEKISKSKAHFLKIRQRRAIATELKAERYAKISGASDADVMAALSALGDADKIQPIAEKVSLISDCVPTSLTAAMGFKMEELFPDPKMIELAKVLYRKSVACGNDVSSAKSAFRLGLILIWQKQYGEIQSLMSKTESVADASGFHSRAKYWRYYAAKANGDQATVKSVKESLIREHALSFANLAVNGDEQGQWEKVTKSEEPHLVFRSLIRPDVNATLRATEALLLLRREKAGTRDFAKEIAMEMVDHNLIDLSSTEPEVRLYAACLLNRMDYTLPKFKILSSLFQDAPRMLDTATLKIYFPLGFLDLVKAKQAGVDPLLILSLIRQESAFNTAARSSVGARGLMQVMPATARTIASVGPLTGKAGKRFRRRGPINLFDPEINVGLGSQYFLKRLEQYHGDVELTLAAYNAGFARVDSWVKRYPTDNKLLFLDFIPFKETREYVSSILRNYYFYTRLYSNDAPTTSAPSRSNKMHAILSANAGEVAYTPKASHDGL